MIFCVEDDIGIRELMLYALRASGFTAEGFETAAEFFAALSAGTPELILLDVMLPDGDGFSILKKLRGSPATKDIPVIMATARGTEFDRVTGLDGGADDYLSKPFGMMEMVSRVKAVLRRTSKTESALLRCGGIEMNEGSHRVSVNGSPVELTVKEYGLLRMFLKSPGLVFTRDAVLRSIWDTDYQGESRTVDVHIGTLRTKLGPCGDYIQTVRGVGYRMEAHE